MESPNAAPAKQGGFFKTFFIAILACLIVLALAVGGVIAYFVFANPQAVQQGAPKAMLEAAGVKTPSMPTAETITAEQIACAVSKLGQERANEIKAGASINASDIALAGSCF